MLRVSIHSDIYNPQCSMKSDLSSLINSTLPPTDLPRELVCLVGIRREDERTFGSTVRILLSGLSFLKQCEGCTNVGSTPLCTGYTPSTVDVLTIQINPFSESCNSVTRRHPTLYNVILRPIQWIYSLLEPGGVAIT